MPKKQPRSHGPINDDLQAKFKALQKNSKFNSW